MLVITRKRGESIQVDGPAEFFVLKVKGQRVYVGIRAAETVRIKRAELSDASTDEGKDATGTETHSPANGDQSDAARKIA